MKFSQSLLDKADSCLLSMQYAIEDPLYYGGSVRAIGTGYHAGLELHYGTHREATLDEILEAGRAAFLSEVEASNDRFIWDEKFPTIDDANRAIERVLNAYFEGTTGEPPVPIPWPDEFEVVGVETPWAYEHEGVELTSRGIDLTLLHSSSGWIVGVDHKTANKPWAYNKHHPRKKPQGPLYVWALQQMYPDAPGYRFAFDVMTLGGPRSEPKFERRIADPTQAQIDAALKRVVTANRVYHGMRGNGLDLPANPASTLCSPKYCDYWDKCPFGAALDTPLLTA